MSLPKLPLWALLWSLLACAVLETALARSMGGSR